MGIETITTVGSRGGMLTFDDAITIYFIQADQHWFLCDTHLGPQSMDDVKSYVALQSDPKEMIIFNSHSDWDHIWGNCAFQNHMIIGHETCRTRMAEIGCYDLQRLSEYHRGNINLVLPNVTFSDRLLFAEDEIEFIYAPGHTVDSSVCFDRKDSVLFIGDLVEEPIPYLDYDNLTVYLHTLDWIQQFPAKVKVSAHSGIVGDDLINRNIKYIRDIDQGNLIDPTVYQGCANVHNYNLNNRLFLKYEHMAREQLRDRFNYAEFKSGFTNLEKVSYTELRRELDRYFCNGLAHS